MGTTSILTTRQKIWAYAKWCEGYRLTDIAEALNVSEKTVRRAINGKPRIRPILRYKE